MNWFSRVGRTIRSVQRKVQNWFVDCNSSTSPQFFLFEELESRYLLSGNILATVVGNDLTIQGDHADNSALVSVVDQQIVVFGTDDTTVNGQSSFVAFDQASIPGSFYSEFDAGNNSLHFDPRVNIQGNVAVNSGDGNDSITFDNVGIEGSLAIYSRKGNDEVAINNTNIRGNVSVASSGGENILSARFLTTGADLFVYGSNESESVVLEGAYVGGNTHLFHAGGNDNLSIVGSTLSSYVFAYGGPGNDVFVIEDSYVGRFTFIYPESGEDVVDLRQSNVFNKRFFLFNDSQADTIQIAQTNRFRNRTIFANPVTSSDLQTIESRVDAPLTGARSRAARLQIELGSQQVLEMDLSSNRTVQSSGTLVTNEPLFQIRGDTQPGSVVELDTDGDGVFDSSTTANLSGEFQLGTTLIRSDDNDGANTLFIRSTSPSGISAFESIEVYLATGTVSRIQTSLGNIDIELLDEDAPMTVANFLNYFDRYQDTFVHRSARYLDGGDFVIQGGGFSFENGAVTPLVVDAPIPNEANSNNSNVRGTVAMALPGGNIDGGTSQWFINLNDRNRSLDDGSFTVFGIVIGDGLNVADAIHRLDVFDASTDFSNNALGEVPLVDYQPVSQLISGTVSGAAGSNVLTGNGTRFLTEIPLNRRIIIGDQVFSVSSINSDDEVILNSVIGESFTGSSIGLLPPPTADEFVFVQNASVLLEK